MLTKITIRNFKRFEYVEVPLSNGMVFIGPNNSGKTSAMEALALWHAGLQEWMSKRRSGNGDGNIPAHRPGITINRKNLVLVPTSHANLLWRNRKVMQADNVRCRIELTVHGEDSKGEWKCGLEFDYTSSETFHCRPLRLDESGKDRMPIPKQAERISLALLPPMSGLAAEEPLIQPGRINVLLGQGRTAEVLRNICYAVAEKSEEKWNVLVERIESLFGMQLDKPGFRPSTGDIAINYKEGGATLDLQSAGRGVQQVILLLAFLYYHKSGSVLLLDEPDAHLEVLRQDAIYQLLNDTAAKENAQIIAASHSEKLLEIAASDNAVVAFVGKPHLLAEGKEKEVVKALASIGWDQYYQSIMLGWILYLEGRTDFRILSAFAEKMRHPAKDALSKSFCRFVGTDNPAAERAHFTGLREGKPDLLGVLLMDKLPKDEPPAGLSEASWEKHEIENYLCHEEALLAYAANYALNRALGVGESEAEDGAQKKLEFSWEKYQQRYRSIMADEIKALDAALKHADSPGLFDDQSIASKNLATLMSKFAESAKTPPLVKAGFHQLVQFIPDDRIDPEIREKLDLIAEVAAKAKPKTE